MGLSLDGFQLNVENANGEKSKVQEWILRKLVPERPEMTPYGCPLLAEIPMLSL